jgi:hypothetical protein
MKLHSGTGIATFDSPASAMRAMQMLNNRSVMGRPLRLEPAPSMPTMPMGPGGGMGMGPAMGPMPSMPTMPGMQMPMPPMGMGMAPGMPMPPRPPMGGMPMGPPGGMVPPVAPYGMAAGPSLSVRPGMAPPASASASASAVPPVPVQMQVHGGQHSSAASSSAGPSTSATAADAIATASAIAAMPPSIRAALSSMSHAELWSILNELKQMASKDQEQVKALLLQYPMLAHAIVHIQNITGNLKVPTTAYVNAALAHGDPMVQARASAAAPAAQSAGGDGGGSAAASGGPEDEQKTIIRNILAMSDGEVAALPADKRAGVEQIRNAMRLAPETLPAELLQLRQQLQALLAS